MQNKEVSTSSKQVSTIKQRLECLICLYRLDPNDQSAFSTFPCNVRAFRDETFKVWRCPNCKTIHSLDVVDLDHYYAKYPISEATLTWPFRVYYGKLRNQLTKHGFSKTHSMLDYGCGVNGLFVNYLREDGFIKSYGYDPYAPKDGFGNPAILEQGPYDYILIQDLIEHVEDPNTLLDMLNSLLAPGGYLLIGTPNAASINLNRPDISDFYNAIHAPYHLHIYTRESLELLGRRQEWEVADFFDRAYHDTRWPSLNDRVSNEYHRILDRTFDVYYEPIDTWKVLSSNRLMFFAFYAFFGYWLSYRISMAIMFRKSI